MPSYLPARCPGGLRRLDTSLIPCGPQRKEGKIKLALASRSPARVGTFIPSLQDWWEVEMRAGDEGPGSTCPWRGGPPFPQSAGGGEVWPTDDQQPFCSQLPPCSPLSGRTVTTTPGDIVRLGGQEAGRRHPPWLGWCCSGLGITPPCRPLPAVPAGSTMLGAGTQPREPRVVSGDNGGGCWGSRWGPTGQGLPSQRTERPGQTSPREQAPCSWPSPGPRYP